MSLQTLKIVIGFITGALFGTITTYVVVWKHFLKVFSENPFDTVSNASPAKGESTFPIGYVAPKETPQAEIINLDDDPIDGFLKNKHEN